MQEVGLKLHGVADVQKTGETFFAHRIGKLTSIDPAGDIPVIVTSKKREDVLLEGLLKSGINRGRIFTLKK
jgi:hypothetical protein